MNEVNNKIIIYSTEDKETKIEVKLENETVWLSQAQMVELFQSSKANVSEHIKRIFQEGELNRDSVVRKIRTTAADGKNYDIEHYDLDMIISLGYRIKSSVATQFRIWATQKLKEYIVKGFVMDDDRLAEGGVKKTYFKEWEERVRKIRTSEANFYQKVRDVFTTSVDYNTKTDYARKFFATVQNKFHFAITGLTAAEIINDRIDSKKENMGLTNWKKEIITRDQAQIAKNYLEELELKRLNLLVEQFLSFAELQSVEERVMYMKDWVVNYPAPRALGVPKSLHCE